MLSNSCMSIIIMFMDLYSNHSLLWKVSQIPLIYNSDLKLFASNILGYEGPDDKLFCDITKDQAETMAKKLDKVGSKLQSLYLELLIKIASNDCPRESQSSSFNHIFKH